MSHGGWGHHRGLVGDLAGARAGFLFAQGERQVWNLCFLLSVIEEDPAISVGSRI